MHPEICRIGPFTIYAYGLMLAVAFITASYLAASRGRKEGIKAEFVFNLAFVVFIFGIIGARILYILQHYRYYLDYPLEMFMLQRGGLSLFGGIIAGCTAGAFYLRKKGLPVYKILDLMVPFVALAQAIGRIGCFLNGCCYGRHWQFGFYFPVHQDTLIPTQLYSSLGMVLIFIILRLMQDAPHKQGEVFYMYLFLYSIKRFLIEFWRADNPGIIFGLTIFHFMSMALFIFSLLKLILLKRQAK
ncbi:MAG: prolipoprotein diacylglyceryl transferase [Candidatus Omnitrophota bacterium]